MDDSLAMCPRDLIRVRFAVHVTLVDRMKAPRDKIKDANTLFFVVINFEENQRDQNAASKYAVKASRDLCNLFCLIALFPWQREVEKLDLNIEVKIDIEFFWNIKKKDQTAKLTLPLTLLKFSSALLLLIGGTFICLNL